mgnify:CR=1 FL=1
MYMTHEECMKENRGNPYSPFSTPNKSMLNPTQPLNPPHPHNRPYNKPRPDYFTLDENVSEDATREAMTLALTAHATNDTYTDILNPAYAARMSVYDMKPMENADSSRRKAMQAETPTIILYVMLHHYQNQIIESTMTDGFVEYAMKNARIKYKA